MNIDHDNVGVNLGGRTWAIKHVLIDGHHYVALDKQDPKLQVLIGGRFDMADKLARLRNDKVDELMVEVFKASDERPNPDADPMTISPADLDRLCSTTSGSQ